MFSSHPALPKKPKKNILDDLPNIIFKNASNEFILSMLAGVEMVHTYCVETGIYTIKTKRPVGFKKLGNGQVILVEKK